VTPEKWLTARKELFKEIEHTGRRYALNAERRCSRITVVTKDYRFGDP
jgi:predicted dithiol-disulfide oxidoreductase (DUF899 family)